ncbi:MAG: RpiB/LacA/LacB family sugar-phosphate isomerase, partial [Oscillospiraceae bacterium]|nr:RpiB/LacA/LacB family sugar-phosphate isomerase [Oscillospiraceae bacterium]
MKIGIGNDHAGTELKLAIINHLEELGIEYVDYGIGVGEAI